MPVCLPPTARPPHVQQRRRRPPAPSVTPSPAQPSPVSSPLPSLSLFLSSPVSSFRQPPRRSPSLPVSCEAGNRVVASASVSRLLAEHFIFIFFCCSRACRRAVSLRLSRHFQPGQPARPFFSPRARPRTGRVATSGASATSSSSPTRLARATPASPRIAASPCDVFWTRASSPASTVFLYSPFS